ncbi:MAG: DUF1080 domain-containing protein [Marinoscillum sp.]
MKKVLGLYLTMIGSFSGISQDMTQLPLKDMSGFNNQAGNWQVVGEVMMDPTIDVHDHPEPTEKKKRKKNEAPPQAVSFTEGTGVLLNFPNENQKSNLVSTWTHGDIELELEVMLPKGSNSGLYLQGRYEVQLYDSWGVKTPKFSDIGGIYRNWESAPDKSYMGKAPLANPAKAPGLWQRLEISFRAPKFDDSGKKIANARIVKAYLNGVLIHDNIEIPLPTGGPVENNEVEEGPIMIQGDHGAVAIRNFKYKMMHDLNAELQDLAYEVYYQDFQTADQVINAAGPDLEGTSDQLTYEVVKRDNGFGLVYTGKLQVDEDAKYTFNLNFGGSARLKIDDEEIAEGWRSISGVKDLTKGEHDIEIIYYKTTSWIDANLGLTISSTNGLPKELNAFSSFPPNTSAVSPILIKADGDQPRLLRAFLDYGGDRGQRLTHTIGVGESSGLNYVYDLGSGNLACVWKGDFVNATPMWHDRGDGSFKPLGMIQYLYNGAPVEGKIISNGYKLDENGRPTFVYTRDGIEIRDKVYPDANDLKLIREVSSDTAIPTYKLIESSRIQRMDNGMYLIGDKAYYVELLSGQTPEIKNTGNKKALVISGSTTPIKYSITW